ncbi:telomeric repeat-binding factor 2 isoform X2 [Pleurodeles waltl]|uniref:telomeric repeat-binding factor 2 isoform X2 n=1 Tax=Pleurodeles waltl TaxID=8319 RepID=UPI0037099A7C
MAGSQEAAREQRTNLEERVVNGWLIQYYFHCALDAFKTGRHRDFHQLRNVLSAVIERPCDSLPQVSKQMRIMQCLSRVEEGENPDCLFRNENGESPLESAVNVLGVIEDEFFVDEDLMYSNKQMLKEAAVVICIKNRQFERASKILKKYTVHGFSTEALTNELSDIICQKNLMHPMIQNFSYEMIKEQILQLFESMIDDSDNFLKGHAEKVVLAKEQTFALEPEQSDLEEQPGEPQRLEVDSLETYSLSALKAAFKKLSDAQDSDAAFSELCETDLSYQKSKYPIFSYRNQSRNKGCSALDSRTRIKHTVSIGKLVTERDSQVSDLNESPEPPQRLIETSVATSTAATSSTSTLHIKTSSPSKPGRSFRSKWNSCKSKEEKDNWSDEEDMFPIKTTATFPQLHPLRAASLQPAQEVRKNLPSSEGVTLLHLQAPTATTGCMDFLSRSCVDPASQVVVWSGSLGPTWEMMTTHHRVKGTLQTIIRRGISGQWKRVSG